MNKDELKQAQKEVHVKAGNLAQIGIRLLGARYNPLVSLEKYNELLHLYIKEANPKTSKELTELLDMMRWNHKKFASAKKEAEFVVEQFPEISGHKTFIEKYIVAKLKK